MSKKISITNWALAPHAVSRLRERNISIEELQRILKSPDRIVTHGPKLLLIADFPARTDNSLAAVVIQKKGDLWLVITVLINFEVKK